mgnify:FL=1
MSVFKSAKYIYVQIIDDINGETKAAASSLGETNGGSVEAAKQVGVAIANAAKAANISTVVFDRGRFRYQGRVQALAESAREQGLKF